MLMRSISEPGRRSSIRLGARAANVAAALALASLLLCGALASKPAQAALKLCGDRHQILERLAQAHEETPSSTK